jgi:hypothetical protein
MVSTKAHEHAAMSRPQSAEDRAIGAGVDDHETPASDEQNDFLGDTVKTVFGQCAGFVDVAAFVIQSCRGESDDRPNRQSGILGPLFETKKATRKPRKNQGGTLEFPDEGTFKDDVSDLSANTLEEMERLAKRRAYYQGAMIHPTNDGTTQPYPGQQLLPPSAKSQHTGGKSAWASPMERGSNSDVPLGVTASDSSSTQEESPHQNRDFQRKNGMQLFRAQVES